MDHEVPHWAPAGIAAQNEDYFAPIIEGNGVPPLVHPALDALPQHDVV